VVGNAREDGKVRGEQLGQTSVVELKLVEAAPLSKYMAGRARNASAEPGTNGKRNGKGKTKIHAPDCTVNMGTNKKQTCRLAPTHTSPLRLPSAPAGDPTTHDSSSWPFFPLWTDRAGPPAVSPAPWPSNPRCLGPSQSILRTRPGSEVPNATPGRGHSRRWVACAIVSPW
jgi:hypothetical protein